jgi:DNA-binding transcriptional LysR family regulator
MQAAARRGDRSRATVMRVLTQLERAFGVAALLERAPGQRIGVLTPEGEELQRRARAIVQQWDEWKVATRDALARQHAALRIGTLPGSFDLIAEPLSELRAQHPELALRVTEYSDDRLLDAIRSGAVDLGFGTVTPSVAPARLTVEVLGELGWSVIVPRTMAARFGASVRLRELHGVPMIVLSQGPARERIESAFAEAEGGPFVLDAAFEVGSTPRIVELVARGFGPAIVSRFRLAFLPPEVVVRPLVDGPPPLRAGVLRRRGATPSAAATHLLALARARFTELATTPRAKKR